MATLTWLGGLFDLLLITGLLWLAWQSLTSTDLFRAIVLFIGFGLLMALAWVRLAAPDIALAEAAIGAGLTGALLLAAHAKLPAQATGHNDSDQPSANALTTGGWLAAILGLGSAAGLAYVMLALPPHAEGLTQQVMARLDSSGVTNPVTAVLLNFRGYDTLLEIVVLLLALLGVWSLSAPPERDEAAAAPVLNMLTRLLLPVLILVAGYLLWVGAHAPGGAFQAGAVLGAAGVLLLLAGWRLSPHRAGFALRLLLVLGPAVFLLVAGLGLAVGRQLLEYHPDQAGVIILVLETAATVSIGVTLAGLFLGRRPETRPNSNKESS